MGNVFKKPKSQPDKKPDKKPETNSQGLIRNDFYENIKRINRDNSQRIINLQKPYKRDSLQNSAQTGNTTNRFGGNRQSWDWDRYRKGSTEVIQNNSQDNRQTTQTPTFDAPQIGFPYLDEDGNRRLCIGKLETRCEGNSIAPPLGGREPFSTVEYEKQNKDHCAYLIFAIILLFLFLLKCNY